MVRPVARPRQGRRPVSHYSHTGGVVKWRYWKPYSQGTPGDRPDCDLGWGPLMALTSVDRALVQRCLKREAGAWNDFVDRFLGLFYHTIHYTAHLRSVVLEPEDVEDLAAEILLQIVANDYAALRQFRGNSSLATYLTVIARRTCVHELTRRSPIEAPPRADGRRLPRVEDEGTPRSQVGLEKLEEVQKLLRR